MGRPTKYDKKKTIKETKWYIKNWKKRKGIVIPSLVGLALHLKIDETTVQEWKKRHPAFSLLANRIVKMQHEELINQGMSGRGNPTITKLLLVKHGHHDSIQNVNKNIEMTHEEALKALE